MGTHQHKEQRQDTLQQQQTQGSLATMGIHERVRPEAGEAAAASATFGLPLTEPVPPQPQDIVDPMPPSAPATPGGHSPASLVRRLQRSKECVNLASLLPSGHGSPTVPALPLITTAVAAAVVPAAVAASGCSSRSMSDNSHDNSRRLSAPLPSKDYRRVIGLQPDERVCQLDLMARQPLPRHSFRRTASSSTSSRSHGFVSASTGSASASPSRTSANFASRHRVHSQTMHAHCFHCGRMGAVAVMALQHEAKSPSQSTVSAAAVAHNAETSRSDDEHAALFCSKECYWSARACSGTLDEFDEDVVPPALAAPTAPVAAFSSVKVIRDKTQQSRQFDPAAHMEKIAAAVFDHLDPTTHKLSSEHQRQSTLAQQFIPLELPSSSVQPQTLQPH